MYNLTDSVYATELTLAPHPAQRLSGRVWLSLALLTQHRTQLKAVAESGSPTWLRDSAEEGS